MAGFLDRRLFWQVYATLLTSLVMVAVVGALLWHMMAERPMARMASLPGAALGALLPGPATPPAEMGPPLARLSRAVDGRIVLLDAAGRPVAAAANGVVVFPAAAPPSQGVRMITARGWPIILPDGRRLIFHSGHAANVALPHMLALLLTTALAIAVAAWPAVSRLTARLERLRASLDAWGQGRLTERAAVDGADEIAGVAASFNAAADRVEALLAAHRGLLAHASHELRSPLTRLRLAVEMFERAPRGDEARDLRAAIAADIAELDGLVEEILLASRLDHGPPDGPAETVDLLALAAEEAARAGAAVRMDGAAVGSTEDGFRVAGSARLLRRMLRNLIENASRHGAPPVEVILDRPAGEPAAATVTVRDHGPGIPEAEREAVFEPFYRPAGRAEAQGSWGLGLSIVRQIARRHGGEVSCQAPPNDAGDGARGGCRFVVTLPLMADSGEAPATPRSVEPPG